MDNNSLDWAIDILKNSPWTKITHRIFDSYEYLYGTKEGYVKDEYGYLFENWIPSDTFHNGIRMRNSSEWQSGWSLYKK